jgi:hypothetical protein
MSVILLLTTKNVLGLQYISQSLKLQNFVAVIEFHTIQNLTKLSKFKDWEIYSKFNAFTGEIIIEFHTM